MCKYVFKYIRHILFCKQIHPSLDRSYLYLWGRLAEFDDERSEGREGGAVAE